VPPLPTVHIDLDKSRLVFGVQAHYLGEFSTYVIDFNYYEYSRRINKPTNCENRLKSTFLNITESYTYDNWWRASPVSTHPSSLDGTFIPYQVCPISSPVFVRDTQT